MHTRSKQRTAPSTDTKSSERPSRSVQGRTAISCVDGHSANHFQFAQTLWIAACECEQRPALPRQPRVLALNILSLVSPSATSTHAKVRHHRELYAWLAVSIERVFRDFQQRSSRKVPFGTHPIETIRSTLQDVSGHRANEPMQGREMDEKVWRRATDIALRPLPARVIAVWTVKAHVDLVRLTSQHEAARSSIRGSHFATRTTLNARVGAGRSRSVSRSAESQRRAPAVPGTSDLIGHSQSRLAGGKFKRSQSVAQGYLILGCALGIADQAARRLAAVVIAGEVMGIQRDYGME